METRQDIEQRGRSRHWYRHLLLFLGTALLVAVVAIAIRDPGQPSSTDQEDQEEPDRPSSTEEPVQDTEDDEASEERPEPEPIPEPVRSRWLFSDASIAAFRASMSGSGPYFRQGDADHGGRYSPGDGVHAIELSQAFLESPQESYWSQPDLPYSAGDQSPNSESHLRPMFAAWIFMTRPDNPDRAEIEEELRELLLAHAADGSLDYLDESKYPIDFNGSASNPIFETAQWFTRLVKARDMLGREAFSVEANRQFDTWIYGYANWIFHWIDDEVLRPHIPDRAQRNYASVSDDWADGDASSFDGGPSIPSSALAYSNRHASVVAAASIAANYLEHYGFEADNVDAPDYGKFDVDDLLDQSRLFVEETLRFSVFPQGFQGDFERGDIDRHPSSSPQLGWLYSVNVLSSLLEIADYHAARGDMDVWEFGTIEGLGGSEGRPVEGDFSEKNLHFFAWSMVRYVNGGWERTNRGEPLATNNFYHDVIPAAIAHRFAPDDRLLEAAWRREGEGFEPYPESPQTQGPYSAYLGEGAKMVGLIEHALDADSRSAGE